MRWPRAGAGGAWLPRWMLPLLPLVVAGGVALALTSSHVARRFAPPAGVRDTLPELRVPAPRTPVLLEARYLTRVLNPAEAREAAVRTLAERYNVTRAMARLIHDVALEEGIDPELGFRLVRVESVFDPDAIGPGGATGLVQMMPGTARSRDPAIRTRRELLEPRTNLHLGFAYLRELIERYEEHGEDAVRLGLLAYNRGSVAVDRALRRGADPENGYGPRVLGPRAHGGRSYRGPGLVPRAPPAGAAPGEGAAPSISRFRASTRRSRSLREGRPAESADRISPARSATAKARHWIARSWIWRARVRARPRSGSCTKSPGFRSGAAIRFPRR
jgi:hypothetical protein